MANLPPRPESPLPRIREDRHYSIDDRERRPAQPMASRFRGDRYSDERVYVPRPRPDTYIAPGFEPRRETEGRRAEYDDRDRDRHRNFDRDRDRRSWGHERDGRRWEGLDRDRRPYERDRGSNRPLSPQRRPVSRRFSRSPSRRRPYSPPALYRNRSRSRSRQSSPSKRFRPGNYSRVASSRSRSRSPYRQRPSRDRSRSRSQLHPENEAHNSKIESRAASPDAIKVEPSDPLLNLEASMVEDHKQLSQLHIAEIDVKAPLNPPQDTLTLNQPINRSYKPSPSQDDIKPEMWMASSVPQTSETLPAEDREIMEGTSHKPSPQSPMPIQAQRSPSPPRPPRNVPESTARVLPNDTQRNWPSRSPPRAPRSHPRQPMPPGSVPSYGSTPRGPRRGFPPTGPASSFSSPASIVSRHNSDPKKNPKTDPDLDIYRAQANRSHVAFEHLQRGKSLRRALHELDLATIDLRAAEIRRHIADVQLEKARNGALGIDADASSAIIT